MRARIGLCWFRLRVLLSMVDEALYAADLIISAYFDLRPINHWLCALVSALGAAWWRAKYHVRSRRRGAVIAVVIRPADSHESEER